MTDASVCKYIRRWVGALRRHPTVAITVEEFLKTLNGYLRDVGYGRLEKVDKSDLKECLRHISTVEIIIKDGKEVVWLWSGRQQHRLFNMIIGIAVKEGEVNIC